VAARLEEAGKPATEPAGEVRPEGGAPPAPAAPAAAAAAAALVAAAAAARAADAPWGAGEAAPPPAMAGTRGGPRTRSALRTTIMPASADRHDSTHRRPSSDVCSVLWTPPSHQVEVRMGRPSASRCAMSRPGQAVLVQAPRALTVVMRRVP